MSTSTSYRQAHMVAVDELPRPIRRRVLVLVLLAVVVVVAGTLTWLIGFSSVFGVDTVTVRGTQVLTARQVRAVAHIAGGTPLARLDTSAVAQRVETMPDVASAQVSTSFPSSVTISVTERAPVGYVRVGRRALLVDRTGLPYRTESIAPAAIPRLVLPIGARGAAARATDQAAATVAAALSAALRAKVSSIQALAPDAVTLVLHRGQVVQWGSASRSVAKARILMILLGRKATQIDVTDPAQPFTR